MTKKSHLLIPDQTPEQCQEAQVPRELQCPHLLGEEYPSRVDLGMSKYGGPFTVEEVEDVKTFLRLIPVILCAGGCNVGTYTQWEDLLSGEQITTNYKAVLAYGDTLNLILAVLGIPLHHFSYILFFYSHIPTMQKKIGFGLLLLFCSFIMSAVFGNVLLCRSNLNITCLFFHSEMFDASSNGLWWILLPKTIYYLGFLLSTITFFEFVFAQTPHSIRGLIPGLAILSVGLSSFIGYAVHQVLNIFFHTQKYILFANNISIGIVSFVYFVLFACVSKQYSTS